MTEPNIPPAVEPPSVDFSAVQDATHALLLAIDGVEVHSSRTQYLIAARAQVLSAQSHIEAHFLALNAHPSQPQQA
jgi:hypothetical protein